MRFAAYLKAIEQANRLPRRIAELDRCLGDQFDPRRMSLEYIGQKARKDEKLLLGELQQVLYDILQALQA